MSEAKRFKFGKRNVSLFCHIHAAEPAAESIVETNFDVSIFRSKVKVLPGPTTLGLDQLSSPRAVLLLIPLLTARPTRRGIFISMKSGARPGRRQGRAPARRPRYPERSRQVSCCPAAA
jgi:hypothetical protein